MYDSVVVDSSVQIPELPVEQNSVAWKTTDIGHPRMEKYRISENGCLLKQREMTREKSDEEKKTEVREYGFSSWSEYVRFCEQGDSSEKLQRGMPAVHIPTTKKVTGTEWIDQEYHGTFEFFSVEKVNGAQIVCEARFTEGSLDEILLVGNRGGPSPEKMTA